MGMGDVAWPHPACARPQEKKSRAAYRLNAAPPDGAVESERGQEWRARDPP